MPAYGVLVILKLSYWLSAPCSISDTWMLAKNLFIELCCISQCLRIAFPILFFDGVNLVVAIQSP